LRHTLRAARPEDMGQLSRFAGQTFRDTYGEQNPVEDVETCIADTLSESVLTKELTRSESAFTLLLHGETIVAYLKTNVGQAQTDTPRGV